MENQECLICGKPLIYPEQATEMVCAVCGKRVISEACCEDGHFVCDDCHGSGVALIKPICLASKSKNPIAIAEEIMLKDFIHMHGPEHHVLVGAALLTAYANAGGAIDLEKALTEMEARGKKVPGGICGLWGSCGAAVSFGIFTALITGSTPLAEEAWGKANLATAAALTKIGAIGGPRCCKRDSFLSILTAVEYVRDQFGIEMEAKAPVCKFVKRNNQCISERCPFYPGK